jgi:hypothetical protein
MGENGVRNFAEMTPFLIRHLGIFYMPQINDMGQTALLPLYMYTVYKFAVTFTSGGLRETHVLANWDLVKTIKQDKNR